MVKIVYILLLLIVTLNGIHNARLKVRSSKKHRSIPGRHQKKARIIEGTPAKNGQWPFVVSIQDKDFHMCGGSIIGAHWVLTACHCTMRDDSMIPAKELTIRAGSIYWKEGTKYKVKEVFQHSEYDNDNVVNDIALMKTAKPFAFTEYVNKIKLSPVNVDDERDKIECTVIGWGYTNVGKELVDKASDHLNYAQIHTIPWYKCKKSYTGIYPTNLCLTTGSMRGSCNGDSGGPLVTYTDLGLVQIGLVSYGDDCNNTKPEVYTRVPLFLDWIRSHTEN